MLPDVPAVTADWTAGAIISADGEVSTAPVKKIAAEIAGTKPILCHGPATAARLQVAVFPAHDVLELFAFVRPAQFCLPTVAGVAQALGLAAPRGLEDAALTLVSCARQLLDELVALHDIEAAALVEIAAAMARGGWAWGPSVIAALGGSAAIPAKGFGAASGLRVWLRLPEWEERAPPPPPGSEPILPDDAEERLLSLLPAHAERREQQRTYTRSIASAFQPRSAPDEPQLVLAEAGTGVGKTLGYIAPASLWAEKNGGAVWLSTFTRNLQRQLDQELDRLHPDPHDKARKVVIRKGRENYFCLLNYEEALRRLETQPNEAIGLGLIARWASATRNGDMIGGDLPGWLPELLGRDRTVILADRRGECIYTACPHYQKCFIERTIRRARHADIVVANHALVMVQAALGGLDDGNRPTRYVFDEGHHIFDAADSAFAASLSGFETAELRRWLLGAERGMAKTRSRGLRKRAEDLVNAGPGADTSLAQALDEVLESARILPGAGWRNRVKDGAPHGPTEEFLALARTHILARSDTSSPYSLEADTKEPVEALAAAAAELDQALGRVEQPLRRLLAGFARKIDQEADSLDSDSRVRIESLTRSLERRGLMQIGAWRNMLTALSTATPTEFVDWFSIERADGHDVDIGLHRHWVDPTLPFARALADHAHGIVVTSATLLNGDEDSTSDWANADARAGAIHLGGQIERTSVPSPFDYIANTRVIVVTDVRKDDLAQVASAYRELFLASGGGALGLFTAISRLREVHRKIAPHIDAAGIPLYAQHVDAMDISTLVDIFRAEEDACLLGTDAVREGVDVPGRSLRLVVFDRVPWPRPDILHKARRALFGSRRFDDAVTRLRLKQAFGRLIRRAEDRGVFVLLDSMMPSRLKGAFPPGVTYMRVGLKEAVEEVRRFLHPDSGPSI